MRRPLLRTLLLVVCVVLTVAWVAPAGRVPPRPVEVSEVDDAPDGELVVEPPQLGLSLGPSTAELAPLRVVNGAARQLTLDVEVLPVGVGPDGAPVVPPHDDPVPSAADWVELPAREVHLAAAEAAAFRPSVTVPGGVEPGGYVAAIRFRDGGSETDGPEVVAFVLVEVPGGDDGTDGRGVEVSLRRVDRTSAVATATFDAGRRGAVDVTGTVRVRSWYGSTVIEAPVPPTLVLPEAPRERQVTFRAPVLPGPYRAIVEDVTTSGLELGSASSRAWLWNPAAVIALAVVLLLVTAWLVYRTARR